MFIRGWTWAAVVGLAGVVGCGRPPARPAGTGAREAAQSYFEALLRQDWAGAYRFLHSDNRARCSVEQFTRLAEAHRRSFGFEPQAVRLRTCDEKESEAVAHVAFTGRTAQRERLYKDAVFLRRDGEGWGVVLPPGFGKTR
jgi:hypothetical protein